MMREIRVIATVFAGLAFASLVGAGLALYDLRAEASSRDAIGWRNP